MCEIPRFDPRTIITVTEVDYSRPCFTKSDKHGVGHLRSAEKWETCVLAASAYFVANVTKLHPVTNPIPEHHSPTMALARNNDVSFTMTVTA